MGWDWKKDRKPHTMYVPVNQGQVVSITTLEWGQALKSSHVGYKAMPNHKLRRKIFREICKMNNLHIFSQTIVF